MPDERQPGSGLECGRYDDVSDVFKVTLRTRQPLAHAAEFGVNCRGFTNSSLLLERRGGIVTKCKGLSLAS